MKRLNGAHGHQAATGLEHPATARVVPLSAVGARAASPTGREVTFDPEEILVTKTDLSGHITYANDVFLRIAGYSEAETLGQPHSFIRHPDMPRGVFKLLWDTLKEGREIFAFVVNLAKSGDHYWVLAHVTPTFDDGGRPIGYHSNRRYAERGQIEKIRAIYDRMLAEERRHTRRPDAAAAGQRVLEQLLAEQHQTYEEFIFSL
ncbi:MAG: PAS domain-containing protein [Myxococcaceae bacterium]|nr:PAS domain-containing protein [Myxococcaceae bacterium]